MSHVSHASHASHDVIVAEGLRKRYRSTVALDGLDLSLARGGVLAVLGPNGAGKTTAIRILTTLTRPDAGRALIDGHDVVRDPAAVRARIGLVGQHAALDEVLGGRQNLVLFGRLSRLGGRRAAVRADELLAQFSLTDAAERPVATYSGGMRRRLDLAVGLLLAPPVLFLDEPTTGLDPRGRNEVWTAIRALVAAGTAVLLTTQYLEEADQLATQLVVIDHGRAIARGTADELKARAGGDRIDVVVAREPELALAAALVSEATASRAAIDRDARRISAPVADRIAALTAVTRALAEHQVGATDIALRRPTLDEVFLRLTAEAAS